MVADTIVTIVGNLTNDPELRYTAQGIPVADLTVASTPRSFDRQANEWKDGDPLFLRCSLWRGPAENAAATLKKGMRVIVQGKLKQRSFETKQGEKRTVIELDVEEIGPSLRYATAQVTRTQGTSSTAAPIRDSRPSPDAWAAPGADRPAWANDGNWDEEIPF